MDPEIRAHLDNMRTKIDVMDAALKQVLAMHEVLKTEFLTHRDSRHDTNTSATEMRLRQEILRLEAMIAEVRATADPIAAYRATFGHATAAVDHDPTSPVCRYCGRKCASSHGRAVHENRCPSNPAAASQAWTCTCGTEGISTVGLGHHRIKCELPLVGQVVEPQQEPMPLQDAIRSMVADGGNGASANG